MNEIVFHGELLILIVPVNQSDSIMMSIKVVAHGMQFYFLIQATPICHHSFVFSKSANSVIHLSTFFQKILYIIEVQKIISDFDNFEDVEKFLKERREVYDAICALDDNEAVVTYQGRLYEEIKRHSMGYYFDTHSYAIGLIDRNNED